MMTKMLQAKNRFLKQNLLTGILSVTTLSALTALSGCGDKGGSANDEGGLWKNHSERTGCIQGVVINGQTGERVVAQAPESEIFVLVQDTKILARSAESAKESQLAGEYFACGVPVDVDFPLFAFVEGYQSFQGFVRVESHFESAIKKSAEQPYDFQPLRISAPTLLANLLLFPKGQETKPFTFRVVSEGKPLADASVQLTPDGTSQFSRTSFLPPSSVRMKPLTAKTNAEGKVEFPAKDLVLGGSYDYRVLAGGNSDLNALVRGKIMVGLLANNLPFSAQGVEQNAFDVTVDLSKIQVPLKLVSTSAVPYTVSPKGEIFYAFNRPIELVPGTQDLVKVSLINSSRAQLATAIEGNNLVDNATLQVMGNLLVVKPKFSVEPDPLRDADMEVQFDGILLQVADPANPGEPLDLKNVASTRVRFFSGDRPSRLATALEFGSPFPGSAAVSSSFSIKGRLVDNLGDGFAGQSVSWVYSEGSSVSQSSATTGSNGEFDLTWTMPKVAGSAKIEFFVGGRSLNSATITVTAGTPSKSTSYGDIQSGFVGQNLPAPLRLVITDGMNPLPGVVVTFEIRSGGGLMNGKSTQEVTTDASGTASINWTLGSAPGTQLLRATPRGWASLAYEFKATAAVGAANSLVPNLVRGTPQLSADLVYSVKATDAFGNGVPGVLVKLSPVNSGSGRVNLSSQTTDGNGLIQFTWTLGVAEKEQSLQLSSDAFPALNLTISQKL